MKQAIEENILCHYDYFPIFVELTNTEMEEYENISAQLRKFIDSDTGKYKPEAEKLLLKRKRVIHKAENKKVAISNLLEDLKQKRKLDYTFVFVPEGYEPDYSESDSYDVDQEDMDKYGTIIIKALVEKADEFGIDITDIISMDENEKWRSCAFPI